MNKVYDVCLPKKNSKGEFVKSKEGKTVYDNWGSVFKDEKGYLSLVLKTVNGDVWFSLFDAAPKKEEKHTEQMPMDEVPF